MQTRYKFIASLFLFLIHFCAVGQIKLIDSLQQLLNSAKQDTTRALNLCKLGYALHYSDPDSAFVLLQKGLDLSNQINYIEGQASCLLSIGSTHLYKRDFEEATVALNNSINLYKQLKDKEGQAKALSNMGLIYHAKGDLDESIDIYTTSLNLFLEAANEKALAKIYQNIGIIYIDKADYQMALDYFLKSLKIKELQKEKNSISIANSLSAVGAVYQYLEDLDRAEEYYKRSLDIQLKEENQGGIAIGYYNLGLVASNQNNFEEAMEYYIKALDYAKLIDNEKIISSCYNSLGEIYEEKEQHEQALEYYKLGMEIRVEQGDKIGLTQSYNTIGKLYLRLEYWEQASNYLTQSIALSKDIGNRRDLMLSYQMLAKAQEKLGQFERAVETFQLGMALKDSLFASDKQLEISRIQSDYDAEYAALEYERQMQVLKMNKQRQALIFLSFMVLLLGILGWNFYKNGKERKKVNVLLEKNNTDLNTANSELAAERHNLEQFIFASSHDLKEYSRNMTRYTQLLEKNNKISEEHRKEALAFITSSSKSMDKILEELLLYTELKLNTAACVKIEPSKLLENIVDTFQAEDIDIALQLEGAPTLFAQEKHLHLLFNNLIANAVQFKKEGEKVQIEIGSQSERKETRFWVQDNGIGIEEEYLDYVFNPFARLHDRKLSGSGLGLAICKKICQLYNGEIWAEPNRLSGTRIWLSLPKASAK